MAGKLVELAEAAKLLGVSTDELTEMRQRGEIHGYRDGASWKFKQEEIDRVREERGGAAPSDSSQYDETFDHLMPKGGGEDDSASEADSVSILVTEESLGKSPETTSSTIIGKKRPHDSEMSESDIILAGDSPSNIHSSASGSSLDVSSGSDVLSSSDAEPKKTGSGTGDIQVESGDSLELDSQEINLNDDDSALNLDDSGELVLGGSDKGSGKGSDVSLDPAGSGINLTNPSDSGLSLSEEPLRLGGGSSVESLELPEDDDVISLSGDSDSDQGQLLKADDEFLLSPMEDLGADDSSDSGSQVIALEDSEAFDENAATALSPAGLSAGPLLAQEQPDMMGQALSGMAPGAAGVSATLNMPSPYAQLPAVEAPYRIIEILLLLLPVLSLLLSGALMFDVLRNMWAFDQTNSLSTAIMDGVLTTFRLQQ